MTPDKRRALAADLEDVLLRFRGHPEDADTLRRVVDELLDVPKGGAGKAQALVSTLVWELNRHASPTTEELEKARAATADLQALLQLGTVTVSAEAAAILAGFVHLPTDEHHRIFASEQAWVELERLFPKQLFDEWRTSHDDFFEDAS